MQARCEVCGIVAFVGEEALEHGAIEVTCIGCGTPRRISRTLSYPVLRPRGSSQPRLAAIAAMSSRSFAELSVAERIDDLHALEAQAAERRERTALSAAEEARRTGVVDVPSSVRTLLALTDPLAPVQLEAPRPSARGRSLGVMLAIAVVAFAVGFTARRSTPRATTSLASSESGVVAPEPIVDPKVPQSSPVAEPLPTPLVAAPEPERSPTGAAPSATPVAPLRVKPWRPPPRVAMPVARPLHRAAPSVPALDPTLAEAMARAVGQASKPEGAHARTDDAP